MELRYADNKIFFKDDTYIIYDDKKQKDYLEMLDNSDLKDMFYVTYDRSVTLPSYLSDPGRLRCEAFFSKMYGNSKEEVQKNTTMVNIFGIDFEITRINRVNEKLKNISIEAEKCAEFKEYFTKNMGHRINYRNVRGAKRLSAHSYGIAIDINSLLSDYWRRDYQVSETDKIDYKNRVPYEIVKIFEDNVFIWGGRWYHYDTMHFEYRPEMFQ